MRKHLRKAEEICGYKRDEIIGKNYFDLDLLSGTNLAKANRLLSLNMMGKQTGPDEFELNRKDGSTVTVEIVTQLISFGGRQVVMGLVKDVTERKEFEAALKMSQERYDVATRSAVMGVWDWDLRTGAVYWSPRAYTMLGYEPDEFPVTYEV